jgi:hypothetical protein
MHLDYHPDAEKACARMEAWWNKAVLDRPAIQVTAPRPHAKPVPNKHHATLRERWLDVEYAVECAQITIANTYYPAEQLPAFWPNLGPEVLSACFGSELEFGETTSWSTPILREWDGIRSLALDRDSEYLRTLLAMQRLALEVGRGKFVVGLTDIHPGADLAASLRDPQQLCLDLVESPDQVRVLMDRIFTAFFEFYELQADVLAAHGQALRTSWLPLFVTNGRYYIPSCDFSIMISNAMFREVFLPELLAEIDWLDRSIYHLDGPGALRHLDTLLEIRKLDAIQFVFGDGAGPATRWLDVYRRIQDAGKAIHVSIEPGELDAFTDALRPEGVMLSMTAGSVEEADDIVKRASRWTSRKVPT